MSTSFTPRFLTTLLRPMQGSFPQLGCTVTQSAKQTIEKVEQPVSQLAKKAAQELEKPFDQMVKQTTNGTASTMPAEVVGGAAAPRKLLTVRNVAYAAGGTVAAVAALAVMERFGVLPRPVIQPALDALKASGVPERASELASQGLAKGSSLLTSGYNTGWAAAQEGRNMLGSGLNAGMAKGSSLLTSGYNTGLAVAQEGRNILGSGASAGMKSGLAIAKDTKEMLGSGVNTSLAIAKDARNFLLRPLNERHYNWVAEQVKTHCGDLTKAQEAYAKHRETRSLFGFAPWRLDWNAQNNALLKAIDLAEERCNMARSLPNPFSSVSHQMPAVIQRFEKPSLLSIEGITDKLTNFGTNKILNGSFEYGYSKLPSASKETLINAGKGALSGAGTLAVGASKGIFSGGKSILVHAARYVAKRPNMGG